MQYFAIYQERFFIIERLLWEDKVKDMVSSSNMIETNNKLKKCIIHFLFILIFW